MMFWFRTKVHNDDDVLVEKLKVSGLWCLSVIHVLSSTLKVGGISANTLVIKLIYAWSECQDLK
jgi:hypothetical protein